MKKSLILLAGITIFSGCRDTPNVEVQADEDAQTLLYKGITLAVQGKPDEAFMAYDACISRFQNSQDPLVREQVATAFVEKGRLYLEQMLNKFEDSYAQIEYREGEHEELELANDAFSQCVELFQDDANPNVRLQAAWASARMCHILLHKKQYDAANKLFDDNIKRYSDEENPLFKDIIVQALYGKAACLYDPEKWDEYKTASEKGRSYVPFGAFNRAPLSNSYETLEGAKGGDKDRDWFGISDEWKQQYGFETNKDIAEEICESGLMVWQAFLLGCNPLLRTTNPENEPFSDFEIYMRGFNPLELAPAVPANNKNEIGDLTRVVLRLSGPGARYVKFCMRPVIHAGPTPREHVLRSGELFDMTVERLPNVKGGAGLVVQLDMDALIGIIRPLRGSSGRFLVPEEAGDCMAVFDE